MYNFQRFEKFAPVREQIIDVFYTSFSASEGETEGAVIRTLVEHLLENTPEPDIFIFAALHDDIVIGCAIFSRLTYSHDARNVFIYLQWPFTPITNTRVSVKPYCGKVLRRSEILGSTF
jgi:hypothetical protein